MRIHESAYIAEGAVIMGEVSIGEESSIWFHSTVRADRAGVTIGNRSNIQDNTVIHVDEGFPVHIGNNVTIGHGAVIHGCRINDNTLIGMGTVILNGARIGYNCVVGAGSLITQNMIIPDNSLAIGCPAKVMRQVTEEEIRGSRDNAEEYVKEGQEYKNR